MPQKSIKKNKIKQTFVNLLDFLTVGRLFNKPI